MDSLHAPWRIQYILEPKPPPSDPGDASLFTRLAQDSDDVAHNIIARGRTLVNGPLAEIKRAHGGQHLTIGFDGHAGGAAIRLFADKRLVRKIDDYGQYAELELAPDADPQELLRGLAEAGVRLSRFELVEPSLHKIFLDLVGPGATYPEAREDVSPRA